MLHSDKSTILAKEGGMAQCPTQYATDHYPTCPEFTTADRPLTVELYVKGVWLGSQRPISQFTCFWGQPPTNFASPPPTSHQSYLPLIFRANLLPPISCHTFSMYIFLLYLFEGEHELCKTRCVFCPVRITRSNLYNHNHGYNI